MARAEAGGNDWNVKAFPKVIFRLRVDEDKGVELELVARGYIPCTHRCDQLPVGRYLQKAPAMS